MKEEKHFVKHFLPGIIFVGILLIVELLEEYMDLDLEELGVYPRTVEGLIGILFSPFIHDDFSHLFSNSLPLIVLTGFILLFYTKIGWKIILTIFFLSGSWTWCLGREAYHIGASGLVYGFASFLFFAGIFRNDRKSLAVAMVIVFLYGSMVWGMFPIMYNVSWEAHLSGALAGTILALHYRKFDPPPKEYPWMEEGYEDESTHLLYPDENGNYKEEEQHHREDDSEKPSDAQEIKFKYIYIPKNKE